MNSTLTAFICMAGKTCLRHSGLMDMDMECNNLRYFYTVRCEDPPD